MLKEPKIEQITVAISSCMSTPPSDGVEDAIYPQFASAAKKFEVASNFSKLSCSFWGTFV